MQEKITNRMWTLVEMLVLCLLTLAATGCATMQRLVPGLGPDEAKVGIRLILDREGYSDSLTDDEISQLVDWVQEDWEKDQARQAFLDNIAQREQNEKAILSLADKYFPQGKWNLPMKDETASEPAGASEPFTVGRHKGKTPTVDPSVVLRSVTRQGGNLIIDCDPLTPWETWVDNDKEVNGWVARLNANMSGTFEMCRTDPGVRSLHNLDVEGYMGHEPFGNDEWIAIVNRDGTKRTNWVKVQ